VRVALCLHGYFGTISTGDMSTSAGGYEHIKERVLSKVDQCDVFIHTWQPEFESQIRELYSPVLLEAEKQIDFEPICKRNDISQEYIDEGFTRSSTIYKNAIASRILSFYYSRYRALQLCKVGKYDWVITTRFDISQRGGDEVNKIRFFPNNPNDHLYTTYWDQMNSGYGDMWFYGSSEIMGRYSKIYKSALNDFKPKSEYEHMVTAGVPDSRYFNCYDFNDRHQFTNEVLKPQEQRSENLMKFPRWRMTDSHLHHKWFCTQNDLYEKTRWV
tara:strand:+ start:166 stop:981 length:816 start_codon:yes stop_codon:yes gene_type:complete